jgi:hypothetical protein
MKFIVSMVATIDCVSVAQASAHADKIKGMIQSPMVALMLKSNGVKLVGSPVVSAPEEKKE